MKKIIKMEKKYVYVIYDPLHEKVLCVHDKSNMECNNCKKIRKARDGAYYLEEHKKLIKTKFMNKKLLISDSIKCLKNDDSEITLGDYFLEIGEYSFIHILIEDVGKYEDFKLPNGIEVIPFTKSDLSWNKEITEYRKIITVL